MRLLLIALGLSLCAAAPSGPDWRPATMRAYSLQPPTPGGRNGENQSKEEPSQDSEPAKTNNRATQEASPDGKIAKPSDLQQKAASDAGTSGKDAPPQWWPWPTIWPHPDWALNGLTFILVVIGFLQSVVFGVQACRLKQTIDTMKDIDERQAKNVGASIAQAARAASAAEASVIVARDTLVTSQRPWVTVDKYEIFSDLRWPGKEFALVGLKLALKNIGNSPALSVTTPCVMFPVGYWGKSPTVETDGPTAQLGLSQTAYARLPPNTPRLNIFPNEVRTKEQMAGCQKIWYYLVDSNNQNEFPHFIIVGCIYYHFDFTEFYRETGFIVKMFRRGHLPFKVGENVSASELEFSEDMIGSGKVT